ncbi:MAG: DUF4159 domain-containing protein [Gloeobacteraceae cyanobacterium ES-bin-144]|nr:DUF4159 domain-containing protein [Verrucomicrobiales bacterium]
MKNLPCLLFVFFPMVSIAAPIPPEPPPLEKPKPPPAQVSSSEGMPPLPYPVVPQKRQERKNPPNPPVLITKIRTTDAEDWARTPHDLKRLLQWMSDEMGASFSSNIKTWAEVSINPRENPVLYRSGYKPFKLEPEEISRLREYVRNGGTILFNALVGHPDFYQSAVAAAQQILPENPVYRIRLDHPVFRSYHEIKEVKYRERAIKDGVVSDSYPWLDGVDIDNRTAIIISRFDIAMGWEKNRSESWGYEDADARRLGANLISYVTAMQEAGRSAGKSVELADAAGSKSGSLRVGWVAHAGPWKTRPAALPMLLRELNKSTGAPVSFELRDVFLTDASMFETPMLYLTGTTDFSLGENERVNLRQFLMKGGVLFAEAGDGRSTFDASFRAEMAKVLPDHPLTPVASTSSLFHEPNIVASVKARPALASQLNNRSATAPELLTAEINGTTAVIYCPRDLSAGWEQAPAPYAIGYESADSTALGVNILFHALVR